MNLLLFLCILNTFVLRLIKNITKDEQNINKNQRIYAANLGLIQNAAPSDLEAAGRYKDDIFETYSSII